MTSYFSKLIIYTLGMLVLVAVVNYAVPYFASIQTFTWISLLFFFAVTAITLYIGLKGLEKSAYGFVASVNGIVLIKLLLSAALVVLYVVIERPKEPKFIIPFFFFYFVFTVFEIRQLLIAQKRKADVKSKTGI